MTTERLKMLRRSKGYTCQAMAEKLGITKSTYNKKENGKMTISLCDAQKISKILERGIDDIFFTSDTDDKER
jgi:putative transcriptional regulator